MEIFTSIFQNFQFNLLELIFACAAFAIIGYRFALRKTNKLRRSIHDLEKEILELNESLLLGKPETPIIKIEHSPKTTMAK